MHDIICEGENCTSYDKCIQYEEKHNTNECKKPKRWKIKACHNDKKNKCIDCDNFQECIIPLRHNEILEQTQKRIKRLKSFLKTDEENEELREELITLKEKEKEKINQLRRVYMKKHKNGGIKMEIIIDSREKGRRDLSNTRKERAKEYYKEYPTRIENLEYGDYVFREKDTEVVFEFKTINDFMQSVFNQSVFEEVANQTNNYDYSYLIIVGSISKYKEASYQDFAKKNHTRKTWGIKCDKIYKGAIRRLRTYSNIITVQTEPQAFEEMLQQSLKCLDNKQYGGCKRRILSQNSVEYYLSGCSGVSSYTIKNIIETLNIENLEDLLWLTVEDLTKVDKIGEKKAERIHNWIQGGEKA